MLKFRPLGDTCDVMPNDPVCRAFYDLPDGSKVPAKTQKDVLLAITQGNSFFPPASGKIQLPGATATTDAVSPGTTVTTITPDRPWFKTWPGILALAGVGLLSYKLLVKPAAKKATPAIAGLFGVRRRRR